MKRLSLTLVALSSIACLSNSARACGYGAYDPDVETYCSGDPAEAKQALANLVKRGRNAVPGIQMYRAMAVTETQHYKQYSQQLELADPALKLTPAQMETEARRVQKWLEWNETRMRKVDFLMYRLGGMPFAFLELFRANAG